MAGLQKSIRLPAETLKEIEQMVKETGRDFSTITKDLLVEAINLIGRRFSQITTDDDTVKNQKCPLSLEGRG